MTAFGVYVHVPFCASKCEYCAFATWTDRHHLTGAYLRAVGTEIDHAIAGGIPHADSIFVGGGTPTMVSPDDLAGLIARIPVRADAEITVECNPDDVSVPLLESYAAAGVNRVSIGVQSMSPHVLAALGRIHDPDNVVRAIEAVRAVALPTFNLDLIYGAAGETVADWEATVRTALELEPPHVSAYGLTVEPGTPLAAQPERHPDDDDQADKYEVADRLLSAAGLSNYEVSNWSRPGHESQHNLLYWRQGNYRGFGCAAHSHHDGVRWWNVRTPDRYIELVDSGGDVVAASERLDADARRSEGLQLILRTRDGVPSDSFTPDALELLGGLVAPHPGHADRVALTRSGRLLANEVALRLR